MDSSMQRVQQSFAGLSTSPMPSHQQQNQQNLLLSNCFDAPGVNVAQFKQPLEHFSLGMSGEMSGIGGKRPTLGIPPSHPNTASYFSQVPQSASSPTQQSSPHIGFFQLEPLAPLGSANPFPSHLPVLGVDPQSKTQTCPSSSAAGVLPSPSPFHRSGSGLDGLPPPYKGHRRSHSETLFGTTEFFSQTKAPITSFSPRSDSSMRRSEVDGGDELLKAFINFDGSDTFKVDNGDKKLMNFDNVVHGMRAHETGSTESSEGSINEIVPFLSKDISGLSSEKKDGLKRSAPTSPDIHIASSRHCRSLSVDSFMGKLNFGNDSMLLSPSSGGRPILHQGDKSVAGSLNMFSLDFGNGEFSASEMEKIMSSEKLAEIAMSDPKRAKRILANRQSAARSKEKKMKYISELEMKVQTLQNEASTLSAQVSMLQRDTAGLANQNNELKFRLQAMDQQAQLRNALNEALTAEVHRLKLATGEISDGQQFAPTRGLFQINQQKQPQQEVTGSAITMESEANSAAVAEPVGY